MKDRSLWLRFGGAPGQGDAAKGRVTMEPKNSDWPAGMTHAAHALDASTARSADRDADGDAHDSRVGAIAPFRTDRAHIVKDGRPSTAEASERKLRDQRFLESDHLFR